MFSTHWNPKEVGFNASEKMELPARASRPRASVHLPCTLRRLPAERRLAHIKGGSSHLKRSGLKDCLSISNDVSITLGVSVCMTPEVNEQTVT